MAFLDDIKDYLVANAGLTAGTDLFLGQMPDAPDDVTVIYQYAGNQPSRIGDNRSPGLQVRARAASYPDAIQRLEDVYAVLSPIGDEYQDTAPQGVIINGTFYLSITAQQEPLPLGEDSNKRPELTQNYIVTYKR